jgi:hypothetical protein
MARKLALIIGNSQYEDAGLARLAAPDVDVRALAEILQTPGIGAFDDVIPLLNEGLATVRKAIARFFDAKHRDDLLLLYFSGHGIRDEQGHLYLAVRDTERAVLAGTAIEASYVTTRMDRSASKRLVLVLDCCHSGAFGLGTKSAQGSTVGTASAFEGTGRGRVVLTATDSTQYAWEGDQVIGDVENSLFTHYLIEGLRSGAADRDEDGQITIDEIYDYVYEHVLNNTPKQTPGKWAFGQQGEIVIAQNPGVTVAKLPPEVDEALKSTLPSVRFQILPELFAIVRSRHEGRARSARAALQRLAQDDCRKVACGAFIYLEAFERGEALTEEAWIKRVREREEELSGRQTVAAQIESFVTTANASLERGAHDEVRERRGRALRHDSQEPTVRRLQARLQAAVDERARLVDAERRIRELRASIAALMARANATASHADAIVLLNEALGLDPEHAEVRQLLETRHRLAADAEAAELARRQQEAQAAALVQAEIERRAQIEGQLAEAARHLEREHLTKAIVITEAVLRADPQNAAARTLQAKARGAIEGKRLADEYAAQKRDRQRRIEDMIATAEAAATHDTAIDILKEVLAKDPGNLKAEALLSRRQAEAAAAAHARQQRREQEAADKSLGERRDDHGRVQGASAPGFSAHPTLMSQVWTSFTGAALRSNTFRAASVVLLAGALTWSVVDNLSRPRVASPPAASDQVASAPVTPTSVGGASSGRDTHAPEGPLGASAADKKNADPVPPAPASAKSGTGAAGTTDPGRPAGRGRSAGADGRPANATAGTSAAGKEPSPSTSTPTNTPAATAPPPVVVTSPKVDPESPKREDPAPVRGESSAPSTTRPADERTPTAPPAPVPDEASLRLAVGLFEAAISSGKPDAIRAMFPSVTERELKDVEALKVDFGRDRYRLNIFIRAVRIDGHRARVECTAIHNGVDDRGKTLSKSKQDTLHFQWTGGTWVRVR